MARKRILIACNTLTAIGAGPYGDHTRMTYRLGRNFKNYDFMQLNARRLSIDRFRNMAARTAIDTNSEYIFFIDDDMHLEVDVFAKLLDSCKVGKYDIVAALNYVRGYPFDPMVYRYRDNPGGPAGLAAVNHEVIEEANGCLISCNAIGTAVCLIRTSVIKRTPAPWFITGPHNTEDIYFCIKVSKYVPKVKIGCHTGAITGHLLDSEVINFHTRKHLRDYYESYMSELEIDRFNKTDHSHGYVAEIEKIVEDETKDGPYPQASIGLL